MPEILNFAQKVKFCQSRLIILPNTTQPRSKSAKDFLNFAQKVKFAKCSRAATDWKHRHIKAHFIWSLSQDHCSTKKAQVKFLKNNIEHDKNNIKNGKNHTQKWQKPYYIVIIVW